MQVIECRRSIRRYTEVPIAKDVLEQLLDAATRAPIASNQQTRRFVVVVSAAVKELVRRLAPGILAMPAALIVSCVDKEPCANPWKQGSHRR